MHIKLATLHLVTLQLVTLQLATLQLIHPRSGKKLSRVQGVKSTGSGSATLATDSDPDLTLNAEIRYTVDLLICPCMYTVWT
jgi:hypothetical protein